MAKRQQIFIGVDTGGTFTDLVMLVGGEIHTHKVPSTPDDFSRGVLQGVTDLLERVSTGRGDALPFDLVHSSTVATNALLEGKGANVGLITTEGFRDVLEIGRQDRAELYNLRVTRAAPLVARDRRLEVRERVTSDGEVLTPLDEADAKRAVDDIVASGVESIAVCLLFSFITPEHEALIGRLARERGVAVSLSSEVLPEFREYERTSTTAANAFVSPVMTRYVDRLSREIDGMGAQRLRVVQSNGGSLSADAAGRTAVNTLLSGPAAGVVGALAVARQAARETVPNDDTDSEGVQLITFDMGGTSTDVALLDDGFQVTTEAMVAGHPIGVPTMDIHTVGAGGGSIAHVDAGGALVVGPQSAGAHPGPACFGHAMMPTVTDANVVLGRIVPEHYLEGRLPLDAERSRTALADLGKRIGVSPEEAAAQVLRIVNANMERAIRVISVARGFDPRAFTLLSFGGAGGLHACDLASALRMKRVLIPRNPGVLSAWGAVSMDVLKDFSQTVMMLTDERDAAAKLTSVFKQLEAQGADALSHENIARTRRRFERTIDVRYAGQSYELNVPADRKIQDIVERFHAAHERRYGHASRELGVQLVTARVRAVGETSTPALVPVQRGSTTPIKAARLGTRGDLELFDRDALRAGNRLQGPCLIVERFATTYVPQGWTGRVDTLGNMVFES